MKKQIVINASKDRSRIAIVENNELVELYIENPDNVRTIGNVYLAKIKTVRPEMKAAFVDVGQKQDCFLHFSDLTDNLPQLLALAGQDVPGLNEPVLSLAPAKRVADDENEPDVEDALEVEETTPESATKSRSRRRSRGRGRSRRGGGRREEEEEQEEQGGRRLPSVIDLSSASTRRPTRRPEPEPEAGEDEEVAGAAPDVVEAPVEEKTPTRSRRTKADAPADPPQDDPSAEADEPQADAEEAPKKKRRRSRGGKSKTASEDAAAEPSDDDTTPEANVVADAPTPTRSRRTKADEDGADTAAEVDTSEDAEEAPKPARSRRAKADATPEADAADTPDDEEEAAPKPKRSRRKKADTPVEADASDDDEEAPKPTRSRRKKADAPDAEDAPAEDAAPTRSRRTKADASDDGPQPGDVSPTGRSRRPDTPTPTDDSDASTDDASREGTPAPSSTKRLPRTLDLTSAAIKPTRSRPAPPADEPEADDSDDEPTSDTSGRSRRRSRGGRAGDDPTEARAESASDTPSDDDASSRSRRGRGRSSDADTTDDKGESGGRRRTRGGRSKESDATTEDAGTGDASTGNRRGRSSSGRSDSGRSDSGRSGSGRSDSGRSTSGRSSDRSNGRSSGRSNGAAVANGPIPPNEELLRRSGNIIVKITKEAISTKGPRVSTDLSLAGRFLVLVPAADYVAVSKKIESAKERRRLRTLATSLKPDRFGVIVRTVAEGRDAKSLDTDLRLLVDKWRKIEQKLDENPEPPVLLYQDVNMVSSVIRDLFSEDYDRILVDDPKVFKNVQAYVKAVAPQMADKVELHQSRSPVFRALGIEKQVEEAFSKRVNMKGGGYLFIETTEAMHVVDVNSGRAGRGKSQKQNLIDVNVEAAREVAKQLRLRDLGGIIVVDFIDLRYDRDRKKVTDVLKAEFEKDRAVTKLLPMSDFGLVQITRQRLRPSITTQATDENGDPLDAADAVEAAGAGEIRRQGQTEYVEPEAVPEPVERVVLSPEDASPRALAGRLRDWLDHYRQTVDEKYKRRPIVVRVHPLFEGYLRRGFPSPLMRWKLSLRGISFVLEPDASVDPLTFDIRDQKSGRTLLKKYTP